MGQATDSIWPGQAVTPPGAGRPVRAKATVAAAGDAVRAFGRRHRPSYRQRRAEEAAGLTAGVAEKQRAVDGLLSTYLAEPSYGIDMDSLKEPLPAAPEPDGKDGAARQAPVWEHYAPEQPRGLGRILSAGAYTRKRAEAVKLFTMAVDNYEAAEAARRKRLERTQGKHAQLVARAREQHANIDRFVAALRERDRKAVSRYFQQVLDQLTDPECMPRHRRAGYVPETGVLAVEWQLPPVDVVPVMAAYHYDEDADEIRPTARPEPERRRSYQRLIAQLALRAVHAVVGGDRYGVVDGVVFNGIVDTVDPVTHRRIRPCLISLRTTPAQFTALELEHLDPAACARDELAGELSSRPEKLVAVEPLMDFAEADPQRIHRRRL